MSHKVGMVSLGCSKNQVDGEMLLGRLQDAGYEICPDAAACEVLIVNTCGFIEDAKRESIESIFECCRQKEDGHARVVVVTGCLAERYQQEIAADIPEADVILGIGKNADIVDAIAQALKGERVVRFGAKTDLPLSGRRLLSTPAYYAYLKVADGCDNRCSYCAIPLIRGGFRSRPMEELEAEACQLVAGGAKEINLIAQDTTRYGEDIYGSFMLPQLIDRLCQIEGLRWLRILYCYPTRVTPELLAAMARQPKVVPYMDIPFQHADGRLLRAMNRQGDSRSALELIAEVRRTLPGAVLRTTLITGFPGETEEQFAALCGFIKEAKFERLGAFAYSQEEDTPAAGMKGQLPDKVKRRRAEQIMEIQMGIAFGFAKSCIGHTLEVLCEGYDEGRGQYFGRSYMDAPDIDTKVYFTSRGHVSPGDFVAVAITAADGYDLVGHKAH